MKNCQRGLKFFCKPYDMKVWYANMILHPLDIWLLPPLATAIWGSVGAWLCSFSWYSLVTMIMISVPLHTSKLNFMFYTWWFGEFVTSVGKIGQNHDPILSFSIPSIHNCPLCEEFECWIVEWIFIAQLL